MKRVYVSVRKRHITDEEKCGFNRGCRKAQGRRLEVLSSILNALPFVLRGGTTDLRW